MCTARKVIIDKILAYVHAMAHDREYELLKYHILSQPLTVEMQFMHHN